MHTPLYGFADPYVFMGIDGFTGILYEFRGLYGFTGMYGLVT